MTSGPATVPLLTALRAHRPSCNSLDIPHSLLPRGFCSCCRPSGRNTSPWIARGLYLLASAPMMPLQRDLSGPSDLAFYPTLCHFASNCHFISFTARIIV